MRQRSRRGERQLELLEPSKAEFFRREMLARLEKVARDAREHARAQKARLPLKRR